MRRGRVAYAQPPPCAHLLPPWSHCNSLPPSSPSTPHPHRPPPPACARSKLRASKRRGERQPRFLKFFQGTLLFTLLLLLLWVPLLLFSSGNPTYTVPSVVDFGVNASLVATAGGGDGAGAAATASVALFPLFASGQRRAQQQWLPGEGGGGVPMPAELEGYTPPQLQLLCTAAVSG